MGCSAYADTASSGSVGSSSKLWAVSYAKHQYRYSAQLGAASNACSDKHQSYMGNNSRYWYAVYAWQHGVGYYAHCGRVTGSNEPYSEGNDPSVFHGYDSRSVQCGLSIAEDVLVL